MANLKASWTLNDSESFYEKDSNNLAEEIRKEIDEEIIRKLVDVMSEENKFYRCTINSEYNVDEVMIWCRDNNIRFSRGYSYWWLHTPEDVTVFLLKWR